MKVNNGILILSDFLYELKHLGERGAILFALITLTGYIYISLFEPTAGARQILWAKKALKVGAILLVIHTALWLLIPERNTLILILSHE